MKVLTLLQPWASCIMKHGKRIENRTWKPPEHLIGQRIAIHAGKRWDRWGAETLLNQGINSDKDELPRGCIIGTAILKKVITESDDIWFDGPYGWVFEKVRPVVPNIYIRGKQGLWNYFFPEEVAEEMASLDDYPGQKLLFK